MTQAEYLAFLARQQASQNTQQAQTISDREMAGKWQWIQPTESDLHDQILDECKRRGWYVVHSRMDKATTCGVGTPDFVIAMENGKTLWVEAKSRQGKARPEQFAVAAWLTKLGHTWAIVRSMKDFTRVLSFATKEEV